MSNETLPMEIEPVLARMKEFPATPDQLIPLLQFCQNQMGYLLPEAMSAIAEYLRLPASHVYGVATFYAQFRFRPLGKNRLTVCRGTACHVRGSGRLVEELERILNIRAGDTTPDRLFSLETVACLGSCALAPAVVVNDKVHGKVTNKKIAKIVEALRGGAAPVEAEPAPTDAIAAPPAPAPAPAPAAPPAKKAEAAPVTPKPSVRVNLAPQPPAPAPKKTKPAAPAVKAKKTVTRKAKAKPASVSRKKAPARKAAPGRQAKAKAAPKPAAKKAKAKPAAVKVAKKSVRKAVAKPAAKAKKTARSRSTKTRRSR